MQATCGILMTTQWRIGERALDWQDIYTTSWC